jgi:hypothetical protein
VEGSCAFRNPSEDMPGDWCDEQCRILHYQELGKPLDAQTRLITALVQFNHVLPRLAHLRIFHPNKNEERGLWALAKLEAQVEPRSLGLIKEAIGKRYGILDPLDVFVEVDRIVDLTRFFTHFRHQGGPLAGRTAAITNAGLICGGHQHGDPTRGERQQPVQLRRTTVRAQDVLSPEALRNANGAVVNKLPALRNPRLWGEGASSCASDATKFESWKQNPMVEWRSRYKGYGVMVYCTSKSMLSASTPN